MGALAHPVTIEIHTSAHLVTKAVAVEWLTVEGQGATAHGFFLAATVVTDLPDQGAVVAGGLQALEAQVVLSQTHIVATQRLLQTLQLVTQFIYKDD